MSEYTDADPGTDQSRLRAELRAARERLAHIEANYTYDPDLLEPTSAPFPWLQVMNEDDLQTHIERLERDLVAHDTGIWPDAPRPGEPHTTTEGDRCESDPGPKPTTQTTLSAYSGD
jgi:hypothetical protein